MLSDALIAIAVVSVLVLLAQSAVHSAYEADTRITESYTLSEEHFETAMFEIGECICTEEENETADISLNSF